MVDFVRPEDDYFHKDLMTDGEAIEWFPGIQARRFLQGLSRS